MPTPAPTFLEIAATEPPSAEDIEGRIVECITDGGNLQGLTAANVFDLDNSQIQALTREDNNLVLQYQREEWDTLTYLGLELQARERAVVVASNALATRNSAVKVCQLLNSAFAAAGRYGVLVTSDIPDSPVWQSIPTGWIRIMAPVNNLTERLPFAGFRFAATDETGPEGWTELRSEDRLLGWVNGSTIRLRFHPFLSNNNRFTTARGDQRQEAITTVLNLALEHLTGEARDDALPPYLNVWREAIRTTEAICTAIRSSTERLTTDSNNLRQRHQQAENELRTLEARMNEVRQRLEESSQELAAIPALEAAVAQRARLSITSIHEQLAQIRAIQEVAEVTMITRHFAYRTTGAAFSVTTHPLTLDCGRDGLREIGPINFLLPLSGVPDPILETPANRRTAHPGVSQYGTMDWGNSSVPLAQALGSDNYAAAARVICNHLGRALPHSTQARNFPQARAAAVHGYHALAEAADNA